MARSSLLASRRSVTHVATAGNFDTEVLQSQSALCVVFHTNSRACKAHIAELETLADFTNTHSNYTWLKVVTVDADRNSNLASAFSVQRRKVPMTFFVCSGTIIDKVSGRELPTERLQKIIMRFKDYFQRSRGVELENHGMFQSASTESLTQGASTESLEAKLVDFLMGSGRCDPATPDGRAMLTSEVQTLVATAKKQAKQELDEVRAGIGADVKKLDDAQLIRQLYATSPFIAATHIGALEVLLASRVAVAKYLQQQQPEEGGESAADGSTGVTAAAPSSSTSSSSAGTATLLLADAHAVHDQLKKDFGRALAHPSVKRVAATAELVQAWLEATLVRNERAVEAAQAKAAMTGSSNNNGGDAPPTPPALAVYNAARHVIALVEAIDVRQAPSSLPLDRAEALINDVRALLASGRLLRAGNNNSSSNNSADATAAVEGVTTRDLQHAVKLTKKALIAALALYADDPHADKLRAKATSLLY